jgi:hypothetical protein
MIKVLLGSLLWLLGVFFIFLTVGSFMVVGTGSAVIYALLTIILFVGGYYLIKR